MSISCQPNKPQKSYQARIIQDTNRNLGLSPVFNVNTEVSPCIENFVSPTYPCDGNMCEPVTGLTIGCPDGYTITVGGCCFKTSTTGITANPFSGATIPGGFVNGSNSTLGAYFYESFQDKQLPLSRTGSTEPNLSDATGGTVTTTNIVDGGIWDSEGSPSKGRLNLTGFENSTSFEYDGVSYCFESVSAKTMYIGFGVNQEGRLKINGETVIDFDTIGYVNNYEIWHVIPWNFCAGKHIVEMVGYSSKITGMEIYDTTLNQLTGATTTGDTNSVFTTADRIGTPFDIGGSVVGYSCPTGYAVDNCGTGLTCTLLDYIDTTYEDPDCLHNLSEINTFDVVFDFSSGNTMYTGYTGEFCYSFSSTLPSATIPNTCIPYEDITGNTVTKTLTVDDNISSVDNSYFVRSWNKFTSRCMTNDLGNTGITIDTSPYIDTDDDCYFVTVINPPKPTLEYQPIDVLDGITFVNDTLPSPYEGSNQILLYSDPINSLIQLTINGLTVASSDYTIDSVNTRLITLNNGITLESSDVVSAAYNKNAGTSPSGVVDYVKLEMFTVTGITTGVTSSVSATTYENIVNYNDVNNRTEIYLQDKIDPGVQPRLTINGVNLSFNVDFFRSNIVQNKLILSEDSVIDVGDIISVYYYYSGINNPGDLGVVKTDTPRINWSTQQNILKTTFSYGNFVVEVADRDDPSFSTVLKSETTLYNNTTSSYTLNVGPLPTTTIDYIYRIKFEKNFVTDNPRNMYTTLSYSDTGSFRLDKSYIDNTNF